MNLTIEGRNINYEVRGKGQTILLIHGWGGSSKSLESLARLLSEKYKVITLDLPGFGLSDRPDPDWGVEKYSQLIIDFICELKLRPVFYFGHSFGGALGIYLAAKYPDYIKKLIISGASYKRNKPSASPVSKVLKWLPRSLKIVLYKLFYPQSDIYKVPSLESNFRKIVTQDLTPQLKNITQPTLILWGENDKQTALSHAKEAKLTIKNSKLKIFPDIGHNLPLKYPELVFAEIEKFL